MQSTFSVDSGLSISSRASDSAAMSSQRTAEAADYNSAFHDLSSRTSIFRNQLIEEFQVLDNIGDTSSAQAPAYTSRDLRDEKLLRRIFADGPNQLIKFTVFRRTQTLEGEAKIDRRLTRAKNIHNLPIGAWAAWVVEAPYFQNFVLFLILFTSILVGISAELQSREHEYWTFFMFASVVDKFALCIFSIEIGLRWLDNFNGFWTEGWNVVDFTITFLSAVPELLALAGGSSKASSIGTIAGELRTLRVLRTIKMIVRFGSLKIIVMTIVEAFRAMAFIMLLLLIVAYIFAIMGVSIFETYSRSDDPDLQFKDYFLNVGNSLITLFILLTLDGWDGLNQDLVKATEPLMTNIYIITWVWMGAFIFRNIFVGVMVNNFDKISQEQKQKHKEYMKSKKLLRMRRKLNKQIQHVQGDMHVGQKDEQKKDSLTPRTSPMTNVRVESEDPGGSQRSPSAARAPQGIEQLPTQVESEATFQGETRRNGRNPQKARTLKIPVAGGDAATPNTRQKPPPDDLLEKIQTLLTASQSWSKGWEQTVAETLQGLATRKEETMWPRDTLFKYFQLMESLQENLKEYQQLQKLATWALLELHDT